MYPCKYLVISYVCMREWECVYVGEKDNYWRQNLSLLKVISDGRSEYKSRDKKKFEFVDAFLSWILKSYAIIQYFYFMCSVARTRSHDKSLFSICNFIGNYQWLLNLPLLLFHRIMVSYSYFVYVRLQYHTIIHIFQVKYIR